MFLIFDATTKEIQSWGSGFPTLTESAGKLYNGSDLLCNDLTSCNWKYVAEQSQIPSGSADNYNEISAPLTDTEVAEQLTAMNAVITELLTGA